MINPPIMKISMTRLAATVWWVIQAIGPELEGIGSGDAMGRAIRWIPSSRYRDRRIPKKPSQAMGVYQRFATGARVSPRG